MPQLERCSKGANFLSWGGPKYLGCWSFLPLKFLSLLLISKEKKKKKRSLCQIGLIFSKFCVDLKKRKKKKKKEKKGHRAKLVCFSPSSLLISNKKGHHLQTTAKVREVWVGMLGSLGGRIFALGTPPSFAPP